MTHDQITVANAPAISGLSFRHFRGESDYPHMVAVIMSSADADKIERADTVDDIANNYNHLTNCDPYKDMIFAEIAGEVIGYSRGWWWDEPATRRMYGFVGFLVPAWRRKGIGRVMLLWMENHLRGIATTHPIDRARFFQVSVSQFQAGTSIMLERAGYRPIRYFHEMARPSLNDIPDVPLPDGLEMRPALPEHYRLIWASVDETSQDEWGYTGEDYEAWLNNMPHFQPHFWQIAWDSATERIAGHVLTFIDHAENERFNRKRGYTEGIGVGRAWRRRGLARALIARSLQAQKAEGMSESALVADSDSISGVTRLYESCGFRVVRRNAIYRKPF
ncbi:MAG TPA: GNAT family N-acetyltransferase [Anaerolineae bacterium]|nr:GNAT family N-acetyltransferase [Anaerolineae bacterium]